MNDSQINEIISEVLLTWLLSSVNTLSKSNRWIYVSPSVNSTLAFGAKFTALPHGIQLLLYNASGLLPPYLL